MGKKTGLFYNFFNKAGDILFPRRCCICDTSITGRSKKHICSNCWSDITLLTHPFCSICSVPFNTQEIVNENYRCGNCRMREPFFDGSVCLAVYAGVLKECIHMWKYARKEGMIDDFFSILDTSCGHLTEKMAEVDFVVPVPLHYRSLKSRGFDQSFLIGQYVSKKFHLPFLFNNLMRVKAGQSQTRLKKKERIKNIRGAFKVQLPMELEGKHILLVDDVMTTTATANECSKMLKAAGALNVTVFTLARTPV